MIGDGALDRKATAETNREGHESLAGGAFYRFHSEIQGCFVCNTRSLGVVWWLFPGEHHNTDGSHRKYLEQQNEWKRFDPDLLEALLEIDKQNKLDVHALEKASVFRNAVFVSDPVPCERRPFTQRPAERNRWLARIKEKLKDCDLIFLDPDNGIASERLKLTQRCAGSVYSYQIRL